MGFFTGTKEKNYQQSLLNPQQRKTEKGLQQAAQGRGGAFQNASNYYSDLLNDDSETFNQMQAPEMRRYNEQIVPDLAEQFAGMGSGGMSSSGFRNAAVGAGTDLSERLGAIRANLRQQGAQGLMNIGQQAMQPTVQNVNRPATEGFLSSMAPAVGTAIGSLAGPVGSMEGNFLGNMVKGSTSPYGNTAQGYDQEFRQRGMV